MITKCKLMEKTKIHTYFFLLENQPLQINIQSAQVTHLLSASPTRLFKVQTVQPSSPPSLTQKQQLEPNPEYCILASVAIAFLCSPAGHGYLSGRNRLPPPLFVLPTTPAVFSTYVLSSYKLRQITNNFSFWGI